MNLPQSMKAMVLQNKKQLLVYSTVPLPIPSPQQVLIKIIASGICRTDLHIIEGDLLHPKLPFIPGHEIVGCIVKAGTTQSKFKKGDIVGVPWLGYTCCNCKYCKANKENLCVNAGCTGYTMNGGFAEYTVAFEKYCFLLPAKYSNAAGAPFLCAGLIGYRSYTMIDSNAQNIGIYGFGASAHILIQIAKFQGKKVFAFTKTGDDKAQSFALSLGANWAGGFSEKPPETLDAAIIFAPVGSLIPLALQNVDKGGIVICSGIHMSDIPSFSYRLLWGERKLQSVANLTRRDGFNFFKLATKISIITEIKIYALRDANIAINHLRDGKIQGAAVLLMG